MKLGTALTLVVLFFTRMGWAQGPYPQDYFRHPLNIPMQLVANFGEIRANHWHMGLDIRTQQRVNLPVYAAADGYIARVSVEPGGFGQAIYINHPNGYTTLYGHLNSFMPELAQYVKDQQYAQQSWRVNLFLTPNLFPVKKGDLIALSGSTGASEGPHVHFEIRDTRTEQCLNPLLFSFPLPDAVPPTITRLALYDRNKSTYDQSPQLFGLQRSAGIYTVAGSLIRTGSDKISFAIGAVDRFTGSANSNGIYTARILLDEQPQSEFVLDRISYSDTRYINAQLDYPYKYRGGGSLQHLTPLPGAQSVAYHLYNSDGAIHLNDYETHDVLIEVGDANGNFSKIQFRVQREAALAKAYTAPVGERLLPNNVNVFERDGFELFTTEQSIYDTVTASFSSTPGNAAGAASPLFGFLSAAIPSHDSVTVRIKAPADLSAERRDRMVIKNVSGSRSFVEKAHWQNGWLSAKFRQFGTYQLFLDEQPPTIPAPATNLTKASRLVFTPSDNFSTISSFRAEVDGQWLRFSNDKGHSWIYYFDEKFPRGEHQLTVTVEDEAGNRTVRTWTVTR
jgi:hypothetical protein